LHRNAFGGQVPPGPTGRAIALPRFPRSYTGRERGEGKERVGNREGRGEGREGVGRNGKGKGGMRRG